MLEGWGRLTAAPPASTVLNLLTLSEPEQRQMCLTHKGLSAGAGLVLTYPEVHTCSAGEGAPVCRYCRGTRAAAAQGSWRKGTVCVTTTAESWTLWASPAAVSGLQGLGVLRIRLSRLRLTADGVDPADP